MKGGKRRAQRLPALPQRHLAQGAEDGGMRLVYGARRSLRLEDECGTVTEHHHESRVHRCAAANDPHEATHATAAAFAGQLFAMRDRMRLMEAFPVDRSAATVDTSLYSNLQPREPHRPVAEPENEGWEQASVDERVTLQSREGERVTYSRRHRRRRRARAGGAIEAPQELLAQRTAALTCIFQAKLRQQHEYFVGLLDAACRGDASRGGGGSNAATGDLSGDTAHSVVHEQLRAARRHIAELQRQLRQQDATSGVALPPITRRSVATMTGAAQRHRNGSTQTYAILPSAAARRATPGDFSFPSGARGLLSGMRLRDASAQTVADPPTSPLVSSPGTVPCSDRVVEPATQPVGAPTTTATAAAAAAAASVAACPPPSAAKCPHSRSGASLRPQQSRGPKSPLTRSPAPGTFVASARGPPQPPPTGTVGFLAVRATAVGGSSTTRSPTALASFFSAALGGSDPTGATSHSPQSLPPLLLLNFDGDVFVLASPHRPVAAFQIALDHVGPALGFAFDVATCDASFVAGGLFPCYDARHSHAMRRLLTHGGGGEILVPAPTYQRYVLPLADELQVRRMEATLHSSLQSDDLLSVHKASAALACTAAPAPPPTAASPLNDQHRHDGGFPCSTSFSTFVDPLAHVRSYVWGDAAAAPSDRQQRRGGSRVASAAAASAVCVSAPERVLVVADRSAPVADAGHARRLLEQRGVQASVTTAATACGRGADDVACASSSTQTPVVSTDSRGVGVGVGVGSSDDGDDVGSRVVERVVRVRSNVVALARCSGCMSLPAANPPHDVAAAAAVTAETTRAFLSAGCGHVHCHSCVQERMRITSRVPGSTLEEQAYRCAACGLVSVDEPIPCPALEVLLLERLGASTISLSDM